MKKFPVKPPSVQPQSIGQGIEPKPIPKDLIKDPIFQSYQILHVGFTAAPLIAGADKFFNGLVDWERYLDPRIPKAIGMKPRQFMQVVGGIELAAGIGVAIKPKIFGYVVSGWLLGIVGNLFLKRQHYDIALRDFGLSLGALALARLSSQVERTNTVQKAA